MGAPNWATEVVCKKEVKGIDVSAWQPNITQEDWFTLKKMFGVDFAFIKATQGVSYKSNTFQNDFDEAKNAGVIRGSYHFYERNVDPVSQADWYLKVLGTLQKGDLRPVLDLEANPASGYSQLSPMDLPRALRILKRIEEVTGERPMLYCGAYAYTSMVPSGGKSELSEYDLWLPMYTNGNPFIPNGFPKLSFWQYTDRGASTEGPIDFNYFNGTYAELKAMTVGGDLQKPPEVPVDWAARDKETITNWTEGDAVTVTELQSATTRQVARLSGWLS